jgi:hypothetical protein
MVYYSRSWAVACLVFVVTFLLSPASTTNAFVVISSSSIISGATSSLSSSSRASHLPASANDKNNIERYSNEALIRNIAATTMLTFGLLFFPSNSAAFAATQDQSIYYNSQLGSSSVQLSAVIQTMDFSLPSSYDKLSDPVADAKAELVKTEVVATGGGSRKAVQKIDTAKDEAAAARAEKVAQRTKALDTVINSSSSSKEEAAAALAERVTQRKAAEAEQVQLEEIKRKEIDANIKAMREEKAAKRAAVAQAERDAAAAAANDEAEDAKYKGVKFMDTSMPTY